MTAPPNTTHAKTQTWVSSAHHHVSERYNALKTILDDGRYFKVVCGAGTEDLERVYRLSMVYSLAGALGIDVSANTDVVRAAVTGVDRAFELAPSMGIVLGIRPFVTVSVGLKGDPHVRKSHIIEDACTGCSECYHACPQDAITDGPFTIITDRCIGCRRCGDACEFESIEYYTRKVDFHDILPRCIQAGAENVELHAAIGDDDSVLADWKTVSELVPHQFISICLDRTHLSNTHLIERVRQAADVAGERLIVQADGAPMSGGADDLNTTLQAVDCANVIVKSGVDARVVLSGGTNSHTGRLAALCGLTAHGVSIGTFARNLIRDELGLSDFESNTSAITQATAKARQLVDDNIRHLRRN